MSVPTRAHPCKYNYVTCSTSCTWNGVDSVRGVHTRGVARQGSTAERNDGVALAVHRGDA